MKIRNKLLVIAALCLAAFVLGACNYGDSSDGQGSIRINFENSGARYAVDTTAMNYTITLTSPGKVTITKTTGQSDTSITIPVPEGNWNIQVDAKGTRVIGEGSTNVQVTAGQTVSANITMTVTGTRVSSWSELVTDFQETSLQNHSIEIVNSFITSSTSGLSLNTTKTITLWAESEVTIKRHDNMNLDPMFTITNCTLILDGTRGGTITIRGNGNDNPDCKRALINVEGNSILEIRNGVTITDNISGTGGGKGGGIYVKDGTINMEGGIISSNKANTGGGVHIESGTFNMRGGVISGNTAKSSGGGIHIESGTFRKTGGIIYGYDAETNDRNMVNNNGPVIDNKGHGVFSSSSNFSDITLGENDDWPTSP
jgi:hypothetical protein